MEWYPGNKAELNKMLDKFIQLKKTKQIHGVIVPHAGYVYSGAVAGKVYSLASGFNRAVIIGPSHYAYLNKAIATDNKKWETSLGKIKIINNGFETGYIENEHSIANQVPFLQKLGVKEVLPIMVGDIDNEQANEIAEKISKINALFVFSTDLSHFLPYRIALEKDKKTIEIIEKLDFSKFEQVDACGRNGLLVLFHLCKLKKWKPKLIEYKNSGDVTGEKASVVGYGGFVF